MSARRPMGDWPLWARRSAYVAVVVVLALVALMVAGVVVARRPLPQVDGTLPLEGLSGKVEVLRDEHGIPQIYAETADDLFRAQGFVQAQDRFFEMDFRRHATAGRLSELLGESTVETDMYIRTMGWRRVAAREYDLLAPSTRAYLNAYSDGVNAYLEGRSATELSVEYTVLGLTGLDYEPQEWTPVDSLAWL
ncbi:MAG TPA: penicillin acylase family protein, partial [Nocardioides sp.]|nr:penicillin acylase family protein [Nocardioides sp.]